MRLLTVEQAAAAIMAHGLVIYPTSTLYGLGCNALDPSAIDRLKAIKGRQRFGFICLVSSMEMAEKFAFFNDTARCLASRFWPGPLTLVLPGQPALKDVMATDGTVALRWDPLPKATGLVTRCSVPIVSTSANLPGRPAPASLDGLDPALLQHIDGVLPAESALLGNPSTVVRVMDGAVEVLREGAVSPADLDPCKGGG